MAQLKNSTVAGSLRVTDTIYTNIAQISILKAPTTSGGSTYGPGSNDQVLKSNGTSVYWATITIPTLTSLIDDSAGNGTTNKVWSADKVYDELTLKASTNYVNNLIAPAESTSTANSSYNKNDLFIYNNSLYKAETYISSGTTIAPGTNCTAEKISNFLKQQYVPINGGSAGIGLKYYIGQGETDEDPMIIGVIPTDGPISETPHIQIGPSNIYIKQLYTPTNNYDAANKYYVDTAISNVVPTAPTTNGTYYLTCTVTSVTASYSWTTIPAANGVSF